MRNYQLLKILKGAAIILLIAMFSVAGIVACSNDTTNPSQSSSLPEETTPTIPEEPEQPATPEEPAQPEEIVFGKWTYYNIHVPWAGSGDSYFRVSYQDTNRLKQIWLDQIKRKGANDGKVFAIRNRANNRDINNFQNPHNGREDYYYFKDNGDIVYKGGDKNNKTGETLMKTFVGAVIVDYRKVHQRSSQSPVGADDIIKGTGKWTVGGIYKMAIDIDTARDKFADANGGPTDGAFEFIAARRIMWTFNNGVEMRFKRFERQYYSTAFMEVLVLNPDAAEGNANCAGLDSYYAYFGLGTSEFTEKNMPYMTNQNLYLGERPDWITPLLNRTTTFTDASRWWSFLVMPGHAN